MPPRRDATQTRSDLLAEQEVGDGERLSGRWWD